MKILVTGGMGEVGRPTVRWLLARGHQVRVLDIEVSEDIAGADCREGDITDFEGLTRTMQGIEGVVHLAAYRHPSLAPEPELFRVNVQGTLNVFRAATDAGVRRLVCASSINALGYNFGIKFPEGQLRYFPIDEEHPCYTTDAYSFSKQMIEQIGAYYWRREGVSSVFLRFPAIYDVESGRTPLLKGFVIGCKEKTAEVLALPEPERSVRARDIAARWEAKAVAGDWEKAFDLSFPDAHVMFGRSNFWTSLDVRDAAQAVERGLTAAYEGSHAVYVSDANNFVGLPSRLLAKVFFPSVTEWRRPIAGTESLVSIEKARVLLGFEPAYPFSLV